MATCTCLGAKGLAHFLIIMCCFNECVTDGKTVYMAAEVGKGERPYALNGAQTSVPFLSKLKCSNQKSCLKSHIKLFLLHKNIAFIFKASCTSAL